MILRGQKHTAKPGSNRPQKRHPRKARTPSVRERSALLFEWATGISEQEWLIYKFAIDALRDSGAQFLLGGGFALATFTGRWRDTKDIDFYIRPKDRARVIE